MRKLLHIGAFILIATISYGQKDWGENLKIASKLDTRVQQVEALTKIYNSIPIDSSLLIGDVCYLLTYRYFNYFKTELDSTLKYANIGINAYQAKTHKGYRLSRLLRYKGDVLARIGYEKEAFEIYDSFEHLEMIDDRAVYSYLMAKIDQARIFRNKGDNEAGIQLLEYAESQQFFNLAERNAKFRFYFEKAISYGIEGTEEYNLKSDTALISALIYSNSTRQKLNLNQQKGKLYINTKQYFKAIEEFEKAFIGRLNLKTKSDSIEATYALNNITYCLIQSDNPQEAIDILSKFIPGLIVAGISKTQLLKLYDNLLSAYVKIDKSVEIENIIKISDRLIIGEKSLNKLSPIDITRYQFDKAEYFFNTYLNDGNSIFAMKALDACKEMDKAAIQYENQILTQRAQYLAKKTIDTLYKLPIEIAGKLKDQEAFFYFTERSKNNLLLQNLGNELYDLLPELDLLNEIRAGNSDNTALIKKLVNIRKDKLNYLFLEHQRNHIETPDIEKFTRKLDGRYCLNYSFGSSNLYLQTIDSQGKYQIHNLGNSLPKDAFESFYKDLISNSGADYAQDGGEFIEHLKSIQIDTSSILIIPDDYLFLFPFDILITEKGPLHTLDHSYELNASLFTNRDMNDNDLQILNSVVVNPSYKNETGDISFQNNDVVFFELPYSFTETDGITAYLGKNLHENIAKDKLQSSYHSADLFHFSGHAILDDNELFSYLPLDANGTNLYAYEFNNWNTNAQMVVLSACETGSGKIAAGEGVLSFSRSIIKSGAKSVVSTLWPVSDQSTSTIISNFYDYLSIGESKSKALSKAKQDFLSTCPDFQKHPYYWAGIIITGDNSPVIFASSSNSKWVWLALFMSTLLFYSLFHFRKKK